MLLQKRQRDNLLRNPLFIIGSVIIILNVLVVLGGAFLRPDSSPYANDQHIELAALKPMSTVSFIRIKRNENFDNDNSIFTYFIGKRNAYDDVPIDSVSFSKNGSVVYRKYGHSNLESIAESELYNSDESIDPIESSLIQKTFILGSDRYGRDLLSRLMSGAYISLSVGIISVLISLVLGITLGLISGYFDGWIDKLIVWFINVIWSVPTLLLVIAITLVLGKGFWQIFIAVGLTMWVEVARVVRGQVMSIRQKEFVEAGIVLGFSNTRIIFNHILPNVLSPVIVISAANFATAILLEAGLSFLGIGAAPPQATWGKMISEHKAYIITGDAHLALIPGIAIMLLVLSLTFIGNGLRDVLDERRTD